MKICELSYADGAVKKRKRVGRGHGCHVKTAGRGTKGQNARSGGGKPPGFEGGQTPWYRRLPKYRGFKNINRIEYKEVTLTTLQDKFQEGDIVTPGTLVKKKIIKNLKKPVKVLCIGEITKPLILKVHKVSKGAKEALERVGGKVELL